MRCGDGPGIQEELLGCQSDCSTSAVSVSADLNQILNDRASEGKREQS